MNLANIFKSIPEKLDKEFIEVLAQKGDVKIERIVSKGHTSPESGWYDQEQHEWVILIQGAAIITYGDGNKVNLGKGDYLNIPAHVKHKVSWTGPNCETIWLAIFYGDKQE